MEGRKLDTLLSQADSSWGYRIKLRLLLLARSMQHWLQQRMLDDSAGCVWMQATSPIHDAGMRRYGQISGRLYMLAQLLQDVLPTAVDP